MDDYGGCFIVVLVIAAIVAAIYFAVMILVYVLGGIYSGILFISSNFFYLFDNLLFQGRYAQPAVWWAIFGLLMGAAAGLVYSGYKYRVTILKPVGIILMIAIIAGFLLVRSEPTSYGIEPYSTKEVSQPTPAPKPVPLPRPSTTPAHVPVATTTSWKIEPSQLFMTDGSPSNPDIAKLVTALEAGGGEGVPVSRHEFIDMLSRPEAQFVYKDEIIKYATPASLSIQKKEHEDYTRIFMRESYQKAGLEFMKSQSEFLARAEKQYGVLRQDIVSILIWESGLGKYTGNYQEFNVFLGQILFLDLAQQMAVEKMVGEGKSNPLADAARAQKERTRLDKRKSSAITNLAMLLRTCKQAGLNPFDMKGSMAGAIGSVQFMPANLKYAVDGDSDGRVDLSVWPDAIMSVANYLKVVGNYESSTTGRNHAFLRYNPSKEYAAGVMLLANTIWQRYQNGE